MPCCNVTKLVGRMEEREIALNEQILTNQYDVIVASFEGYFYPK